MSLLNLSLTQYNIKLCLQKTFNCRNSLADHHHHHTKLDKYIVYNFIRYTKKIENSYTVINVKHTTIMYIHSEYILTEAPIIRTHTILPKSLLTAQLNVTRFDD